MVQPKIQLAFFSLMLHRIHTTYTLIYIYTHSLSSEDVMTGRYTHDPLLSVNVIMSE